MRTPLSTQKALYLHPLSYILWIAFFLVMFSTHYLEKGSGFSILSLDNIRLILYPLLLIGLITQIILGQKIDKSLFYAFLVIFIFVIIFQVTTSEINFSVLLRLALFIPLAFVHQLEYRFTVLEKVLLTISIVLSLIYSYSQGFIGDDNRFVANSDDPNLSGLTFLLGFYFAARRNYTFFKYCFIILGLLTLSRNFILAILLFYAIKYFKEKKVIKLLLSKIPIWLAIFLFNFGLIVIGQITLFNQSNTFQYSTNTSSRVLHWKDTSNKRRIIYNQLALIYIFKDTKSILNGYGEQYTLRKDIFMPKYVHNTLIDIMMSYGLVITFMIVLLIFLLFQRVVNISNYEYLYSYLFFSMFLPGCFSGFVLYAFYAVLCVSPPVKFANND